MSDFLTPAQIRGARGMLDWTMLDLARASGLSVSTVKRMEVATPQAISDQTWAAVRVAFGAAGVRFLADDGGGGLGSGCNRRSVPQP